MIHGGVAGDVLFATRVRTRRRARQGADRPTGRGQRLAAWGSPQRV